MPQVLIIGAGISGLSCAWTLKKLGVDALVVEAAGRPGGIIRTERINGYRVEAGPNSFQAAEPALQLVEEGGLIEHLAAAPRHSARFVYWNGKLRKFPFGPLGTSGILRLLSEPLIRSKSPADESVRDFFVRRAGPQAHDRLVAPALTGIYASDTANLSMAAVFPKIVQMEREHGSLAGAFLSTLKRRRKPADASDRPRPKGSTFSFEHGMEALPRGLAEQLRIEYNMDRARADDAPAVVLATPAGQAANIVAERSAGLADLLRKVEYAPMAIAAVSLPDDSFPAPLQGFGFLAARGQGVHLLGALFSSALFPNRAPKGQELLTCFIGGAFEPEAIGWSDERIFEVVCSEIHSIMRTSEIPRPVALYRQPRAIPQYKIGHDRWAAAVKEELARTPGLFIAGNYLEGVSVPACIEHGSRAAHAAAEYLGRRG